MKKMPSPLVRCPGCKGTKNITITVCEFGKPARDMLLDCHQCDGSGEVTQCEADAIETERQMWCECSDGCGDNIAHYADGQHPSLWKHHYRHEPGCGKVVQIG